MSVSADGVGGRSSGARIGVVMQARAEALRAEQADLCRAITTIAAELLEVYRPPPPRDPPLEMASPRARP